MARELIVALSLLNGISMFALVPGWRTGVAHARLPVVVGEKAMSPPIVELVPVARHGWSWAPGHWIRRRDA